MAKHFNKIEEEKKEVVSKPYWVIIHLKRRSIWAGGLVTYFDSYEAASAELKLQESKLPPGKKDHGYVIEKKWTTGIAPPEGENKKEIIKPYKD